jgi:alanine dehydrogenase
MKIGIPKEIKTNENRVALTPAGAKEMVSRGHSVFVQAGAGEGSGLQDELYRSAGAIIVPDINKVYENSELIVKVKEPISPEYGLIRKDHVVFTYFHFASSATLTEAMIKQKPVCIAYETVEKPDRSLPLLTPMSEIAGRMSIQEGAKYLEKQYGGRGVLLAGVPGVRPANVLVLGGGVVGLNAAKMAAGLGANVTIMDININRLRQLEDILPSNVDTVYSNSQNILEAVRQADLIVGAVLIPGSKAPVLVPKEMLKEMKPGTVLIDVAVDQGGCIETCKPTTHEHPIYLIDGIVHYCVANMPGAVPNTSTLALTNVTLPYALMLADKGWKKACNDCDELRAGLNMIDGQIVNKPLADSFGMKYKPSESFLR